MIIDVNNVVRRLDEVRDLNDLTLLDVSRATGLSVSFLSQLINKKRQPSVRTLAILQQFVCQEEKRLFC